MSSDPKTDAAHDAADVEKQKNTQLYVGGALAAFVLVAVCAAFFPAGSPTVRSAAVAIAAFINVFLVSAVSMHLKSEKKTITQFLVFTAIFLVVLFGLTALAFFDSTGHHH